jgi:hypothetical protein
MKKTSRFQLKCSIQQLIKSVTCIGQLTYLLSLSLCTIPQLFSQRERRFDWVIDQPLFDWT